LPEAEIVVEVINCINENLLEIPQQDRVEFVEWVVELYLTIERLVRQRIACEEILGDPPTALQIRLHQACVASWTLSAAFEAARLASDLASLDGDAVADLFYRKFLSCLNLDPDASYER